MNRGEAASLPFLSGRNAREPLTITVAYRGGPEAYWELRARGRVWRVAGSIALHDALSWVQEGHGGRAPEPGTGQGLGRRNRRKGDDLGRRRGAS